MDKKIVNNILYGRTDHIVRDLDVDFNNLHLAPPCEEYLDSFREAILEYLAHRVEEFVYPSLATKRDVRQFFKNLEDFRRGKVPKGFVPASAFWLVDGKHYLGSGDVRHELNDNLRRLGGNIGYSIRPAVWGKGLGTAQLMLLLKEAYAIGVKNPIITCYDKNFGSIKVIEKNGGILINRVENIVKGEPRLTRIYEISLEK